MCTLSFRAPVRLTLALAALLFVTPSLCAQSWKVEGIHRLPDLGLSEFLAEHVGLAGVVDHGINLGGIGSDLWRGPGDGPGIYWMITDRGPNGEAPRTFPVP